MSALKKFKGCLLGALLGDCLGAPFEGERRATKSLLQSYLTRLGDPSLKLPYKMYTDDTAMTLSVAKSLIHRKEFDSNDMAQKFVKEFYKEPNRGYGGNVVEVFAALRATQFKDVFAPAAIQFNGTGSYGNGAAMRVAPVALFCYKENAESTIEVARKSALITHSNRLGVHGAILQCLAVHQAVNCKESELDSNLYLDKLGDHMKVVEKYTEDEFVMQGTKEFVYGPALEKIRDLLERGNDVTREEVESVLGNDIAAHRSVPTAIFAFLRSFKEIDFVQTSNPFQRTIHYAISFGGDTDTIASMAGAIAGAYYGVEKIPEFLQKHCESPDLLINLAEELYSAVSSS